MTLNYELIKRVREHILDDKVDFDMRTYFHPSDAIVETYNGYGEGDMFAYIFNEADTDQELCKTAACLAGWAVILQAQQGIMPTIIVHRDGESCYNSQCCSPVMIIDWDTEGAKAMGILDEDGSPSMAYSLFHTSQWPEWTPWAKNQDTNQRTTAALLLDLIVDGQDPWEMTEEQVEAWQAAHDKEGVLR